MIPFNVFAKQIGLSVRSVFKHPISIRSPNGDGREPRLPSNGDVVRPLWILMQWVESGLVWPKIYAQVVNTYLGTF